MRRSFGIIALIVCLTSGTAGAQSRGFGLGLIIGEPTGLSAKLWQSHTTALDFAAAWSFTDEAAFHLHGDYLFHNFRLIHVERGQLPVYYGIGLRVKLSDEKKHDDTSLGLRIPVGLDYLLAGGTPLDVFMEIVPILDLVPNTDVTLNASLGVRYWFH
jgi:hypothetical protein